MRSGQCVTMAYLLVLLMSLVAMIQSTIIYIDVDPENNISFGYGNTCQQWNCVVKTSFSKIAINLDTMMIVTNDFTYAVNEVIWENANQNAINSYVPYGTSADCSGTLRTASIDIRGSGFRVVDEFGNFGWLPSGSSQKTEGGQVVKISGRGSCGWACSITGDSQGSEAGCVRYGGEYIRVERWYTCFGIPSYDSTVCNSKGTCIGNNMCNCTDPNNDSPTCYGQQRFISHVTTVNSLSSVSSPMAIIAHPTEDYLLIGSGLNVIKYITGTDTPTTIFSVTYGSRITCLAWYSAYTELLITTEGSGDDHIFLYTLSGTMRSQYPFLGSLGIIGSTNSNTTGYVSLYSMLSRITNFIYR
jgi:hypothetical protein